MRRATTRVFEVHIIYVCLDTPERNIRRVQERVSQGGHDVPDDDVRRRYERSLANLPDVIRAADRAVLYDNSEGAQRKVLEVREGRVVWSTAEVPDWVVAARTDIAGI
jgi:predicted ABC-type ATPase